MDNKAILAIALSLAIWLGWQKYYLEPLQKTAQEQAEALAKAKAASETKTAPIIAADQTASSVRATEKSLTVQTKVNTMNVPVAGANFNLNVSNSPELISNWTLTSYYKALEKAEGQIDLGLVTGFPAQLRLHFNDQAYQAVNEATWGPVEDRNGVYRSVLRTAQVNMERSLTTTPDGQYFTDVNYRVSFNGTPPAYLFIELLGSPNRVNDQEGSILGQAPDKVKFTYRDGTNLHTVIGAQLEEAQESMAGVRWFGLDTRYFVLAIVPDKDWRKETGVQLTRGFVNGAPAVRGSLVFPTNGKKELNIPLRVFFGPKQLDALRAADPILTDAIDFGWTSFLALPILSALKWLYGFFHNYGVAIILLTAAIKILLYPLTYKSTKAMSKMAKLQPQLNALREKYKDNKEKLNTEMMAFMKTHGYNPIGGCLPILIQMPIFFALYRVLFNSIELYQAPFVFWINDLSHPDPFYVTPIVLAGLMFVQQKLTPNTAADPAQQRMMQIMPLMFGVFMLMLPAGLTLYMLVNSIVSILQQWFLNNKFGVYDAARQQKAAKAAT